MYTLIQLRETKIYAASRVTARSHIQRSKKSASETARFLRRVMFPINNRKTGEKEGTAGPSLRGAPTAAASVGRGHAMDEKCGLHKRFALSEHDTRCKRETE